MIQNPTKSDVISDAQPLHDIEIEINKKSKLNRNNETNVRMYIILQIIV